MPSLDIDTSDAFPFGAVETDYKPGVGFLDYGLPVNFGFVYHEFPFRRFRESTSRNSPVAGGPKIPSPFKLRVLQWYSTKPKITEFLDEKKVRRAFHLAKVDWRRRRPVKDKSIDAPTDWEFKEIPSGRFVRFMGNVDPRTKLATFRNQPITVMRLRPTFRAWKRRNPNLALNAFVNDLTFWKQDGILTGNADFGISNTSGQWDYRNPIMGGTGLGFISVDGFQKQSFFDSLNMDSPYTFTYGTVVDPQNLLIEYADKIDELGYLALKRHYAKLQNQKIDLATETSQAMQTVNMIIDLSVRLGKAFNSVKKLNIVGAFQALFPTSRKELANDYLVYQYGIKPLLGDVVGAAEHLAEFVLKARPVKSNGHAQKSFVESTDTTEVVNGQTIRRISQKTITIRVKFSSIFHISSDLERQAAQLGFTNPANVIWELVPFSFVADWFLPIGDFLTALTSLNGLTIKESYKTVFINIEESLFEDVGGFALQNAYSASVNPSYPAYHLRGSDPIQDDGYLFFRRGFNFQACSTTFCKRVVLPLPDVPTPRFKSPISGVHLAEAIALFSQLRER
jgi:hypothetical protein